MLIKSLALLAILLLLVSLFIILNTPYANQYEFSIYDVFPSYLWLCIIISIILSILIIFISIFSVQENNKYWLWGVINLIISNSILFFMPYVRGYYLYGRGDVLTHIGHIKDILLSGHVGDTNVYPILHILSSYLILIPNISLNDVTFLVMPLLSVFYIISIYLLARELFENDKNVLLVLAFVSLPIFGSTYTAFAPFVLAFLMTPFVIYTYFKSRTTNKRIVEFSIIALIMLFFVIYAHPLVFLALIIIIISLEFTFRLFKNNHISKIKLFENEPISIKKFKGSSNLIIIGIIAFFSWNAYLSLVIKNFTTVYLSIIGETMQSQFSSYSSVLTMGKPTLYQFLTLLFNRYGQLFVFGVLSLIVVFYSVKKRKMSFYQIFLLIGVLIFSILSLGLLFGVSLFDYSRMYMFAIIFAIILVPVLIYELVNNTKFNQINKKKILSVTLISLIFISYFSIFNLYFSPITKTDNQQVTKSEFNGMKTFFSIRDTSMAIMGLGIPQSRFYDAIYGIDQFRKGVSSASYIIPPDHFGYNNSTSISDYYKSPRYLMLSELDRKYYNLYPEENLREKLRYNQTDYANLELDQGAQKMYSNGNLEIFYIQ